VRYCGPMRYADGEVMQRGLSANCASAAFRKQGMRVIRAPGRSSFAGARLRGRTGTAAPG
jgi:hypothetical protein